MDVISVDNAGRVLNYTSGRLQPLTEMEQLTPAITSELVEFLQLLLVEICPLLTLMILNWVYTTGGFYLGVVDLSTCVTLKRILVLYYVCPEETSELISRPEAIESQSLEGSRSVEGECVENSSTESGANPILICGPRGQWNVIKPCLCNPGYQLDSSHDKCSGTSKRNTNFVNVMFFYRVSRRNLLIRTG